jgi:hypothetical protein
MPELNGGYGGFTCSPQYELRLVTAVGGHVQGFTIAGLSQRMDGVKRLRTPQHVVALLRRLDRGVMRELRLDMELPRQARIVPFGLRGCCSLPLAVVQELPRFPHLTALHLNSWMLAPGTAEAIGGLRCLRQLRCRTRELPGNLTNTILQSTQLTMLDLSVGKWLPPLQHLTRLQELQILWLRQQSPNGSVLLVPAIAALPQLAYYLFQNCRGTIQVGVGAAGRPAPAFIGPTNTESAEICLKFDMALWFANLCNMQPRPECVHCRWDRRSWIFVPLTQVRQKAAAQAARDLNCGSHLTRGGLLEGPCKS